MKIPMSDADFNEIFDIAQMSSASHLKCVQAMKKIYSAQNEEHFTDTFIKYLSHVLQIDYKVLHPYAERSIEFIAAFATSMDKQNLNDNDLEESVVESRFLRNIVMFLLQTQDNIIDVIRFRSCQVISKILLQLSGIGISIELFDHIQSSMLERFGDGKVAVRMQAAISLQSLQDVEDVSCPIIAAYIKRMENDQSSKVRKLCVEKVCPRVDVIPYILRRTRDTDVKVRLEAFNKASKHPNQFKIVQKQLVIKNGFRDESSVIQDFVSKNLVTIWLNHYENNYMEFLKSLRLDSDLKDLKETTIVVEYVLNALFCLKPRTELITVLNLDENKLLPFSDLSWESVLFWRFFLVHLRKFDEYDVVIEGNIPELVRFCSYINEYFNTKKGILLEGIEFSEYQFIMKQFFFMAQSFDFGDEMCRQTLNSLITDMLMYGTFDADVIKAMIDCLDKTMMNIQEQIRFVCELTSVIIHDCHEEMQDDQSTPQSDFEIAQLKVKLQCLIDDQAKSIKERNFMNAEVLKHEIEKVGEALTIAQISVKNEAEPNYEIKKTDIHTILKILDMTTALLESPKVTYLTPMLRTAKEDFVQELLPHENPTVRSRAHKCFALYCIIDETSAKLGGIHLFCGYIESYNEGTNFDTDTVLNSIGAIVDAITLFGTKLIANPNDSDQLNGSCTEQMESVFQGGFSLTPVVQGLVDLLNDDKPEIQERAGYGLCTLILNGRIKSPSVVSRLIIKWCSPINDDEYEEKLRQAIGLTLERLSKYADGADQLQLAILPTLKTIVKAPRKSPLAEVNIEQVSKLLVELCRPAPEAHSSLALSFCQFILEKPKHRVNLTLAKLLMTLDLQETRDMLQCLLTLCDQIQDKARDKFTLLAITKFKAKVIGMQNKLTVIEEVADAEEMEEEADAEEEVKEEADAEEEIKEEADAEVENEEDADVEADEMMRCDETSIPSQNV